MFADAKSPLEGFEDRVGYYGGNAFYELRPQSWAQYPDVERLNGTIKQNFNRDLKGGYFPDYYAEEMLNNPSSKWEQINSFNPSDIVDWAGAYDSEHLAPWLYDRILQPRGLNGVRTNDGAVSFSPNDIRLLHKESWGVDPEEYVDPFKKLKAVLPWMLGGGIAAGSMFGSSDAQAATHTHADANNLDRTIERLSKAMPLNDMASGMVPRATQSSVQPINNMGVWQQMEQQGRVTPDLPVPEAEWSPVDLATAPIGAAGKVGKLAAMALDAPTTLAVNHLIDALSSGANTASSWWNGK